MTCLKDLTTEQLQGIADASDILNPEKGEADMRAAAAQFGVTFDEDDDVFAIGAAVDEEVEGREKAAERAEYDAHGQPVQTVEQILRDLRIAARKANDYFPGEAATEKQIVKLGHLLEGGRGNVVDNLGLPNGCLTKKAASFNIENMIK